MWWSDKLLRRDIALLLLCAILSDTLNCKSVTTTARDKFAVALLAEWAQVEDHSECVRALRKPRCVVCFSTAEAAGRRKLQECAGCHLAQYCGRECQRQHWSEHKMACREAQKMAEFLSM